MKYILCPPGQYVNIRDGAGKSYNVVGHAHRADEIVSDYAPGNTMWRGVEMSDHTLGYVSIDFIRTWRPMLVGDMFGSTTLKANSTGQHVRNLQRCLIYKGYLGGTIDGIFGTNTENAVKKYQKAKGLTQDGKVGANTKNALYNECYALFDADNS